MKGLVICARSGRDAFGCRQTDQKNAGCRSFAELPSERLRTSAAPWPQLKKILSHVSIFNSVFPKAIVFSMPLLEGHSIFGCLCDDLL